MLLIMALSYSQHAEVYSLCILHYILFFLSVKGEVVLVL
jgi:hypothetical protein